MTPVDVAATHKLSYVAGALLWNAKILSQPFVFSHPMVSAAPHALTRPHGVCRSGRTQMQYSAAAQLDSYRGSQVQLLAGAGRLL